jgi:hypothetical protein
VPEIPASSNLFGVLKMFMHRPKNPAAILVGEMLKDRKPETEEAGPNPQDAEMAAITALIEAIHSKDSSQVKSSLKNFLEISKSSEDETEIEVNVGGAQESE